MSFSALMTAPRVPVRTRIRHAGTAPSIIRIHAPQGGQQSPKLSFRLSSKQKASHDSQLLRFALPAGMRSLGLPAPSGVKAVIDGFEKSYSPVSDPGACGHFDLLVKAYPPRPGGGVGAFLCGLQPGEAATLRLKPPRPIHGDSAVARRWEHLGLLCCGTGVAPFVQVARALLADATDTTALRMLYFSRTEADILMRDVLDDLARRHPERFRVTYSLTQPGPSWTGARGRGDVSLARAALPPPGASSMVMVCGTDGFVEAWAGARTPTPGADGKTIKGQGSVRGVLRDAVFRSETEVYRF